jgi:Nucleotidyl transferase AbiEii toxin, Type IV TA system
MTTSVPGGQEPLALTDFQVEVAQLFFSLPAASGFLLAGGAALVAQHLTTRPTQDLDFFTHFGGSDVPAARDALEAAASNRAGAPSGSETRQHSAGSSTTPTTTCSSTSLWTPHPDNRRPPA